MPVSQWISESCHSFSLSSKEDFEGAVSSLIQGFNKEVSMLAFGECLHFGEEFLILRNEMFKCLVKHHGYRSIVVESSFINGILANQYVLGTLNDSNGTIYEEGFSHNFGQMDANKELIDWMRNYNANLKEGEEKINFYGFDAPTEAHYTPSPRKCLEPGLKHLEERNKELGEKHRKIVEEFVGKDSDWENPEAMRDPSKSIGLSKEASQLRVAVEDLICELKTLPPSNENREDFEMALHMVEMGRTLLDYHANLAGKCTQDKLLTMRDLIAFQNVQFIAGKERGKMFLFAHNSHLQRTEAVWPWFRFWPLGSRLSNKYGKKYYFIAGALGSSQPSGISDPEEGSLERHLLSEAKGEGLFIKLDGRDVQELEKRSGSKKNMSYSPIDPSELVNIDALAFIKSVTWTRGAPTFPEPSEKKE
eukprot:TRINITY_DN4717_c0_g1_i1.p1 TRINITY_DN4717_c0_g1~~TRINITY_DN4717_c0_g1_i1.p1  ORF type:complete len:420 (-),score=125.91 TRINITY_DN4717_c0_g1_i1:124-1383(-)